MDDATVRRVAEALAAWADGQDDGAARFSWLLVGAISGDAFSLDLDKDCRKYEGIESWSYIAGSYADARWREDYPANINVHIERMTPAAVEALAVMLRAINGA